jgi:endonuclease/exonuclease/phosphatase family metal-dependent hydrolase
LRIATWNIRELGSAVRWDESIRMIATLLRVFDIVAIVELQDDLRDIRRVLKVLGPRHDIVFSDYLRDAGGDRVGFVFDSKRVLFTGLASTAEGPRRRVGDHYERALPWWRPPFLASFRAARFDFVMVAAHLRWGATVRGRSEELAALADWIVARSREAYFGDKDIFAVGDFNLASKDSQAFRALTSRGFAVPPGLLGRAETDLARRKRYDQILYLPRYTRGFTERGGVVDFYCGDHRALFPGRRVSKVGFTFQLSDHLPLWAELAAAA